MADGLPANWVNSVAASKESGYLWLATPNGIARFDGVDFRLFDARTIPALRTGAWSLDLDADGIPWIGTRQHGLLRLEREKTTLFPLIEADSQPEIRILQFDPQGRLWIGTLDGLFLKDGGSVQRVAPNTIRSTQLTAFAASPDESLWIGTLDHGLFRYELGADEAEPFPLPLPLEGSAIQALTFDQNGFLWIGARDGLARLAPDGTLAVFALSDGLPDLSVRSLFEDSTGTLWVGTEREIVQWCPAGHFHRLAEGLREKTGFVVSFTEDWEGNLWAGSKFDGLRQFWEGKFTVFGLTEKLHDDVVNAVIELPDESFLLGVNQGTALVRDNEVTSHPWPEIADYRVRNFLYDSQERLWIATYNGLYRQDPDSTALARIEGLSSELTRVVLEDSQQRIWVGTRNGLNRLDPEGMRTWQRPELRNDFVLDLKMDATGALWIATDGGGVARSLDGENWEWFGAEEGLAGDVVFDIAEDTDGHLWFATAAGISVFRGKTFQSLTFVEGLPSEIVFQILFDDLGKLWLTTHEGLFRSSRESLLAVLDGPAENTAQFTRYGLIDGLRTDQMTSVGKSARTRDGRLLFATSKGLAVINPAAIQINAEAPRVLFETVRVNGETVPLSTFDAPKAPVFGPSVKRLAFDFTAATLLGADKITFRWRLLGFDEVHTVSNDRQIFFTNLSPGHYTLEIAAANEDGVWADSPETLAFVVAPHFHERAWFLLCIILASIALGYGLYALKGIRMRRRALRLEALVVERTQLINKQKETIEKGYRDLLAGNAELKRLNAEKSFILGIAAHDMKNPLSNLTTLSAMLREELAPASDASPRESSAHEHIALIERSSHELLQLVQSIINSISLESGELALQTETEDLPRLVQSVIALNQASAAAKGQVIQFNAPPALAAEVDALHFRSAIDNYLSNAIKYSPLGATTTVALESVSHPSGDRVRLSVCDEGPGLREEDFPRAFRRFSRLSARTTSDESSSGLGLAIVRQIIELHGGEVGVRNNSERGATFFFEVPVKPATTANLPAVEG